MQVTFGKPFELAFLWNYVFLSNLDIEWGIYGLLSLPYSSIQCLAFFFSYFSYFYLLLRNRFYLSIFSSFIAKVDFAILVYLNYHFILFWWWFHAMRWQHHDTNVSAPTLAADVVALFLLRLLRLLWLHPPSTLLSLLLATPFDFCWLFRSGFFWLLYSGFVRLHSSGFEDCSPSLMSITTIIRDATCRLCSLSNRSN